MGFFTETGTGAGNSGPEFGGPLNTFSASFTVISASGGVAGQG